MRMLLRFPELLKKSIVKVFIGSAASTGVKILTGIVLSKIVAEKLGPEGLGLIGQLTSFISMVLLFAAGGYQNGIISYTAVNKANGNLAAFVKPSLKLTLLISLFCGVLLFFGAGAFSQLVFKSTDYKYVFNCFGFTILLYSLNTYVNSFLNGISDFKNLSLINIINSIFSLIVSVVLIFWLGVKGALLAAVLSQTLTSLTVFRLLKKYKTVFRGFLKSTIERDLVSKLLPYIKMTVFSMIFLPLSQFLIRNFIAEKYGGFQVGIWEAVNKISGIYLTVIINVMLIYYLPRLSLLNKRSEIYTELKKGIAFFGGILIVMGVFVYLFRTIIIHLFLSPQFNTVADFTLIQLAGDFFRVLYYLFAYFVIAKSLTAYYIITETLFFALYMLLAYFLVPLYGVKGAVWSYVIMNLAALIIHLVFVGKMYFKSRNAITKYLFS